MEYLEHTLQGLSRQAEKCSKEGDTGVSIGINMALSSIRAAILAEQLKRRVKNEVKK